MLRKIIPIILTLAVLIGAFVVYNHFQPKVSSNVNPYGDGPSTVTVPQDTGDSVFKKGEHPWMKDRDASGRIVYQFKADFYDHRDDGSFLTTNPVIELFQSNGQIVHIEGKTGVLHLAPGADKGMMNGVPVAPPRDGSLQDVLVKIYGSEAELKRDAVPLIKLTMSNAQFDNATYRLTTQEFKDADGTVIPSDMVPVHEEGKDYNFDGTGLTMYWNERDKHLKSLEIAHGKQLTLHNTSMVSIAPTTMADAPAAKSANPAPPAVEPVAPAAVARPAAAAPPAAPLPKQRYYATFSDDVRITQANEEIVRAKDMFVDFMLKGGEKPSGNSPTPAPPPAPGATAPPPTTAASSPVAAPAVPANKNDVIVTWKGKLRIVPKEDDAADPLEPGQSIIRFVGDPVVITQKPASTQQSGTKSLCAEMTYHSADSRVVMNESPGKPVIIQQPADGSGTVISTPQIDFSRKNNKAILAGPGWGRFPDPNDAKSILKTDWKKSCVVNLLSNAAGQMQVDSCDLTGNVSVDHPRFDIRSEELKLIFEPAKKSAAPGASGSMGGAELSRMIANGSVLCHIKDPASPRSIQGQQLQLFTENDGTGKRYAKTILADGDVTALEVQQEMDCGHLKLDLLPAPKIPGKPVKPAGGDSVAGNDVQLQRLEATENVKVKGKDGANAAGEKLVVETIDGHQQITLTGSPAVVINKDSTTTGPIIHVVPDGQTSSVDGAGTLVALQQAPDPKQKPRHVNVSWKNRVDVLGKENIIKVRGDVHLKTESVDGEVQTADADAMDIALQDKPPTTQPVHRAPATQSAVAGTGMDFMQNKLVKSISLNDKARVESQLMAGGVLIKRSAMMSQKIDYQLIDKKLIVPGPGGMVSEDHQPATQPSGDTAPTGRGSNAIEWKKQMSYDENAHQAKFEGGITIVHVPDGPDPKNFTVTGDEVIADVQPAPVTAVPATADSPRMQLKLVTINGHVIAYVGDTTVECGKAEYDPISQLLTCSAAENGRVKVSDESNRAGVSYDEAVVDLKNNSIRKVTGIQVHTRG